MSLINGHEHDWSDIKIYLSGIPVSDIKEINYRKRRDAELQHGSGSKPYGVGYGNQTVEGDMTLVLEEYNKFSNPARALGKSVMDYAPFPIIIAFADKKKKTQGDPPREYVAQEFSPTNIRTIKEVVIIEEDEAHAQADKELVVKLTFIAADLV